MFNAFRRFTPFLADMNLLEFEKNQSRDLNALLTLEPQGLKPPQSE